MNILRIKDNSRIKKEGFSDISNITDRIADKTLEQLDREGVFVFPELVRETKNITGEQMILKSVNDSYYTGNIMGFLGCGNEQLVIESRFCKESSDYFIQYLLDKVLDFSNIVNLETYAGQDNQLFSLFLFLFPHYLKTAVRKGLFKTYTRHEYNDDNIKGTVDITRHIAENTPFTGRVAYSRREYSYDNYLTELVRHTIEFIRKQPHGNNILIKVKDEVRLVVNASSYKPQNRQKIMTINKQNTIRHSYYREYRVLQKLCLLILQHWKHQIDLGTQRIYGILFDGAWLWEEYINTIIGDNFYHPENKSKKGKQYIFAGNIGKIYPDFISLNNEPRIIADAKYKPINNISGSDYFQVLTYMFRFDAKKGYYLYPDTENADDLQLFMNKGTSFEKNTEPRQDISVIKHGLKIPINAEDYDDFVLKMQNSEEDFTNELIK